MALQKTSHHFNVKLSFHSLNSIEDALNGSLLANKLEVCDCCPKTIWTKIEFFKHPLTILGQIIHKGHIIIIKKKPQII